MQYINILHKLLQHKIYAIDAVELPEDSPELQFVKSALVSKAVPYSMEFYYDMLDLLIDDERTISIHDLGAGSRRLGNERKIKNILMTSVVREKYAALLSRFVYFQKPGRILELGTSLGASTLCMASVFPESKVCSVDGCSETHRVAKEYLSNYPVYNIELRTEEFFQFLVSDERFWDFVYIDGNHQYEASLKLVAMTKEKLNKNGIIIMDDIHWSNGMIKAWKEIVLSGKYLCIDIFRMGILLPGSGYYRVKY
jgi:predicted O-methyltransferase YrrM